jgi:hypothetical protein
MTRIQIWADLSDEGYEAYAAEAERRGVRVESLVEQTVNELLRELEHDSSAGTDIPIIPC